MFDKSMLPAYIYRPTYMERLKPYIYTPLIKVLAGQRRVGKSYILYQLIDDLLKLVPAESIIYINKEHHEFRALQTGFDVHIGYDDGREIDFVCEREGRRIYVQASYVIADAATAEREFGNLRRIRDNHLKYLVTMDSLISDPAPDGIQHLHLGEFLLTRREQLWGL